MKDTENLLKELEDKIIDSIERYIVHYVKNYGGIIYYDVDKQEDRLNTDAKAWLRQQIPLIKAEAVREVKAKLRKQLTIALGLEYLGDDVRYPKIDNMVMDILNPKTQESEAGGGE